MAGVVGFVKWLPLGLMTLMLAAGPAQSARLDKIKMSRELRSFLADIDELRQPNFFKLPRPQQARHLESLRQGTKAFAASGVDDASWQSFHSRIEVHQQLIASEAGGKDQKAWQRLSQDLWNEAAKTLEFTAAPSATAVRAVAERIYQTHCQECHGQSGDGHGLLSAKLPFPMESFAAGRQTVDDTPVKFFTQIANGRRSRGMPTFDGILKPEEIWHLSFYLQAMPLTCQSAADDPEASAVAAKLVEKVTLKQLATESTTWLLNQARRAGGADDDAVALRALRCLLPFDPNVQRE